MELMVLRNQETTAQARADPLRFVIHFVGVPRKVKKIVLVAAPIQNSLLLRRLMINLINQAREVFCQGDSRIPGRP
jgi:hypothetical protein